ncbi:hypothetical protein CCHR01_03035 [Colletotrichum chrysophilum]|uniref:Uncharacterized protein n=1 Tax=Colletotrichum chrysophilum TaxID=1836956 RepID=A0AAD9AX69_9PEZI|nr:hypothetical protein CCHR01_03035 [Colletotrichum chrysophilum]
MVNFIRRYLLVCPSFLAFAVTKHKNRLTTIRIGVKKETSSGDTPLYNRLDDDESGNRNLVSKEELDRPSTNKSVATKLSFFILGFLVAMTISAIIAFLVPVGLHDGLRCAESP